MQTKASDAQMLQWHCSPDSGGVRLDTFMCGILPEISRARIQRLIRDKKILVDGMPTKAALRLHGHESITCMDSLTPPPLQDKPEAIALNINFQNDDFIIVDKPAGMVVHPGAGNHNQTLVNALLYAYPHLQHLPRAGLVHRLDKDTSGLILVAQNQKSYSKLVECMSKRLIRRHYLAICWGNIDRAKEISLPIGRSAYNRLKFTVRDDGKHAYTRITPRKQLADATLVDVELFTGRTHQIRVHMHHIGFPLVGDKLYCSRSHNNRAFPRQALHATTLYIPCVSTVTNIQQNNNTTPKNHHIHQSQGITRHSPLPHDMQQFLQRLTS